jgi:tRNA-splicing ligase RtcB
MISRNELVKITDCLWEIPKSWRGDMHVPARIYADEKLLDKVFTDKSLEQLVNVATLPGVQKYALAMPDMHEGYGFPIGGVAAMDPEQGVISPGGVGYDINCGVRVLRSDLRIGDLGKNLSDLMDQLQRGIPSGLGRGGAMRLDNNSLKEVLEKGVKYVVGKGYGEKEDMENCEEEGSMREAQAAAVSDKAKQRGRDQLGTLGSGNHFLEVQKVDEIFDEATAQVFGLFKDQITVMIHSGSRGLGHQVCSDFVSVLRRALGKYKIQLKDLELACAPINSSEGQQYFAAMAAAANFAWANRQIMTHLVRQIWHKALGRLGGELKLIYDVAHNIAKMENQRGKVFCIHRKGATRAFASGMAGLPEKYKEVGQPVLLPGTMGTASYLFLGQEKAAETFYSVAHGAGRLLSRHAALRVRSGQAVRDELEQKGIAVRTYSVKDLAEEAPLAYKDIDNVAWVMERAGLAKKVARLKPLGVLKG